MNWQDLIAAFAGGAFGAAIGALPAFIFCGVALLAGVAVALAGGGDVVLDVVANGPFFGPHIAFAGGVAGAAYAARRRQLVDGKDIATALAELGRPGPLLVGGLFGAAGQLIMGLGGTWLDSWTNGIAFTVIVLGVTARLIFGRSGLFGRPEAGTSLRERFRVTAERAWVPHQSRWSQAALLGLIAGAIAGYVALEIGQQLPEVGGAAVSIGFAISAVSLIFAVIGKGVPVTHHMTLTAAVAASLCADLTTGLIVAGVVGAVAGLLGEFLARAFQVHGDTHIDPPGNAIWSLTAVVFGINTLITSAL
ncbi:MAG: hypothetical protein WA971_11160 [Microbacterium sp.]